MSNLVAVAFPDRATAENVLGTLARLQTEHAIDRSQAAAIAAEARRIAAARGVPLDIEWAIDDAGTLWILQARAIN